MKNIKRATLSMFALLLFSSAAQAFKHQTVTCNATENTKLPFKGFAAWHVAPSASDSLLKVTMTNGVVIYVSPVDNNGPDLMPWGGYGKDITELANFEVDSSYTEDLNGKVNTIAIVAKLSKNKEEPYAAKLCADLVAYGFDDWYLPSAGELNEIYKKLGPIKKGGTGQLTTGTYWSSTEYNENGAWYLYFDDGYQSFDSKETTFACRCVRR